jgi:hypothetical protein
MTLERSLARRDEIRYYCRGKCHVFAVALHRRFGWRLHLVVDLADRCWQDLADEKNFIPWVVHVYAIDDAQNAWDVVGVRPSAEVRRELEASAVFVEYASTELLTEIELRRYVGGCLDAGAETTERPLDPYSDVDVALADAIALRVLGHLPDFFRGSHPRQR